MQAGLRIAIALLGVTGGERIASAEGEPAPPIEARAGQVRVGLLVGEPNGFSAAVALSEAFELHGEIGHANRRDASLVAAVDAVYRVPGVFGEESAFAVWVGLGGRFTSELTGSGGPDRFGLRVPFGISYSPLGDLELFAAVAPALSFVPDARAALGGGVGIRVGLF